MGNKIKKPARQYEDFKVKFHGTTFQFFSFLGRDEAYDVLLLRDTGPARVGDPEANEKGRVKHIKAILIYHRLRINNILDRQNSMLAGA